GGGGGVYLPKQLAESVICGKLIKTVTYFLNSLNCDRSRVSYQKVSSYQRLPVSKCHRESVCSGRHCDPSPKAKVLVPMEMQSLLVVPTACTSNQNFFLLCFLLGLIGNVISHHRRWYRL
uniref:Uncharacterized protein n=1 Tax=Gadus morhua TaxID=8049 RepID=A0A8C5ACE6_GADMO